MNSRVWVAAAALAISGFLAPAANAALVTNGGFETGDFTGWTPNAVSFPIYTVTAPVASGTYAAQIAGFSYGPDMLSQTITTAAAQSYRLNFDYWQDGGPSGLNVTWNGNSVFMQTPDTSTGVAFKHVTATVVGTGSDSLVFTAYNDPAFTYIDNVALSVPEPTTWALMFAGFGGLGLVMRGRRRTVSITA